MVIANKQVYWLNASTRQTITNQAMYANEMTFDNIGISCYGIFIIARVETIKFVNGCASEPIEDKTVALLKESHYAENTTRQCLERWSTYYDLPIVATAPEEITYYDKKGKAIPR